MRRSQLNFVATFPNFVVTQFKEKAKNIVATITQKNVGHKCCNKSTTKGEDIEAAHMSRQTVIKG